MRRLWTRAIKVLPLALTALAVALPWAPGAGAGPPGDEILVRFRDGVTAAQIDQLNGAQGAAVSGRIPGIGVQVLSVGAGNGPAAAAAYSRRPEVLFAEVNGQYAAVGAPNDPNFSFQWGMAKAQAPQAWDVTTGSASTIVAVLDTGVDASHPDLAGKVISSVNQSSSATVGDVYGHGTHVAGIAAAATNNGVGVAGLGYNTVIQNVKVLSDNGSGAWSWIASGITWAADNGAKVINMSLGGASGSDTVQSAVDYAWSKGVVVVAAAGNSGNSAPFYPAYYTNVIAVAATDSADGLASFSNRGDWVDVAAPGSSILSTTLGGGYGYMSGTSMASPHVAGLAALVAAAGKSNSATRACIQTYADNIGVSGIGGGRINAYKSVLCGSGGPPPPTTGAIAGTVTDAASAVAIAGATVSAGSASATTSATGSYTLTGLAQGSYTVTASASGFVSGSQSVSVTAGATSTANFSLAKVVAAGAIAGTVTDASTAAAIAGAAVSAGSASANTDATGSYTLTGFAQGSYTVTASALGYPSASQTVSVSVGATSSASFSLSKDTSTGSIVGTVTDGGSASAVAGATVTAGSASTTTDSKGNYALTGLAAGSYTVSASSADYATATATASLSGGQTLTVNFSLLHITWVKSITFKASGNSGNLGISVAVVNWHGDPLVSGTVLLEVTYPDASKKNLTSALNTSGIAAFSIQKAPKGTYTATVTNVKAGVNVFDSTKGESSDTWTF